MKAPKGYFTIIDFMTMNEFERANALREYRDMVSAGIQVVRDPEQAVQDVKSKARRKKSAYSKALSQELKKINKTARTKSGKLRKGMTQKKILARAHKAVKRRMK